MMIKSIILGLVYVTTAYGAALEKRAPAPFSNFTRNEFFKPAADAQLWGTLYARSLQLPDESLLMTWENYPAESKAYPVNHPIYKSVDGGATWSNFSAVKDTQNGWGMRFQPFLYTLPTDFGGYARGTILAAGVSTPESLEGGVYIEVYASKDGAKTWEFVSHIAYGDGPNTIKNGDKALWEPFFLMYKDQLVCYYSDQRDPKHAQKLVHTTTTDLKTWSDIVEDEAESNYDARPGMTTVAHIESTNKWIMTWERCGVDACRVYYKVSDSPLTFGPIPGTRLEATDGSLFSSGPYVTWVRNPYTSDGSGIIIVSTTSSENILIQGDNPAEGKWKKVDINHWSAYSRSVREITVKGTRRLLIGNGGNFGDKKYNGVADAVVPIPTL
ncbi:Sialidase [Fusarium oxysporum]|nr:Sialidase [Fusarium oxysporum]